jgi:hypothetical protein
MQNLQERTDTPTLDHFDHQQGPLPCILEDGPNHTGACDSDYAMVDWNQGGDLSNPGFEFDFWIEESSKHHFQSEDNFYNAKSGLSPWGETPTETSCASMYDESNSLVMTPLSPSLYSFDASIQLIPDDATSSLEQAKSQRALDLNDTGRHKKPKLDESIIVFSVKQGRQVKPPRRSRFGNSRRKEVALNRIIGACMQCKLRKGSVSGVVPKDRLAIADIQV